MSGMFSQFLNDPHIRHAILIHFPIVFALLGILPLLALLATRLNVPSLKVLCVAWFVVASAGAFFAAQAGEAAEDHLGVRSPGITQADHDQIEHHEELAENGWLWPLIPAALVLLTFPTRGAIRKPAFILACVAALGVAAWVALTASSGGKLVYDLGLGVHARTPPDVSGRQRPIEAPNDAGEQTDDSRPTPPTDNSDAPTTDEADPD